MVPTPGVEPGEFLLLREMTLPICPHGHFMVAQAGLEPATHEFSVHCSTIGAIVPLFDKYFMRFYEFNEEIDRRGFLKGLTGAAALGATGLSKAGDYIKYDDLIKDPESVQKVWIPRMVNLQERADKMLARLINAAGPDWAKYLKGTKVSVQSNSNYAQATTATKNISIDLTVFWDADDATLAFIIGHELGHIGYSHTKSYDDINKGSDPMRQQQIASEFRKQEMDADNFAIALARILGYNKAEVFKFMHKKESEYAYIETLTSSPNSTHPRMRDRIERAKLNGFQLSKGGIDQMNNLKQHLA